MTHRAVPLLLLLACAGLAGPGCAGAEPPARAGWTSTELPLTERVARALAEGERAADDGRQGAAELLEVSRFLLAAGARTAEPAGPDLAQAWWNAAVERGAPVTLPPYRGRPLGPAYRRARIAPGATASLEQLFLAGQRAEIALMPTRPSALVLEVSETNGRTICRRRAEDPPAQCAWLPVFTTRHAITIKNEGRAAADYFLVVN